MVKCRRSIKMNNTTQQLIAKNLRKYLDNTGTSQAELADALGVHASNVTLWLKEKTTPRPEMVDKICRYFKISKEELMRDPNQDLAVSKTIPIYHSIYRNNEYFDDSNIERYLAVDQSVKADFGIIVYSDSMSDAGINPGDIAFFTKDYTFKEGHIYAVWITGKDSVILKRVYHQGTNFVLISENANESPMVIDHNHAFIIGELFGIYKEWKWDK